MISRRVHDQRSDPRQDHLSAVRVSRENKRLIGRQVGNEVGGMRQDNRKSCDGASSCLRAPGPLFAVPYDEVARDQDDVRMRCVYFVDDGVQVLVLRRRRLIERRYLQAASAASSFSSVACSSPSGGGKWYHASCGEDCLQEKQAVRDQKCPQPGQQPAVQNVFQRVRQPEPGSPGAHTQRLSGFGSQLHSGQ